MGNNREPSKEQDTIRTEYMSEKKFTRNQAWKSAKNAGIFAIIVLAIALIITTILNAICPNLSIGASILRDIIILLISSVAALLGLYVAAYTFLNDSLKKRVEDDPTIKETVNIVLSRYRANMFILIFATIGITAGGVLCIILLGKPWETAPKGNIEDIIVTLRDWLWYIYIIYVALSVFVISWSLSVSHGIINSDAMLTKQAETNLKMHGETLRDQLRKIYAEACYDVLIGEDANTDFDTTPDAKLLLQYADKKYTFALAYLNYLNNQKKDGRKKFKEDLNKALLSTGLTASDLADSIKRRNKIDEIKEAVKSNMFPEGAWWEICFDKYIMPDQKAGTREEDILFGKAVRFIELIVNKICDNNIDKSIMSGDYVYDSMISGFQYLYAQKEADPALLDVRDRNRFFDQLKYQIITDKRFKDIPFDNSDVEKAYERAKEQFYRTKFAPGAGEAPKDCSDVDKRRKLIEAGSTVIDLHGGKDGKEKVFQVDYILKYKYDTKNIINRFFSLYRHLVGYRDALIHYDKFKDEKTQTEDSLFANDAFIIAEVLKRVLIDRFTSFVKTDELNLGNSNLDKGWFNYSDISKSNFTHSSCRFIRLENATARECDFSACNFILADASNTDFSGCNFSYSNLTGMDLNDCNLNKSQFSYAILRDNRIDTYLGLEQMQKYIENEPKIEQYFQNMEKWHKEVTEKKDDKQFDKDWDEQQDDKKNRWREGKDIREGIWDQIKNGELQKYCTIGENEVECSILNEEYNKLLKLDNEIRIILGLGANTYETDFVGYRKYHIISEDAFKEICVVRQYENDPKKYNNKRMSKDQRETIYGKIYFGVANLKAATLNETSMEEMDFSHVTMEKASFRDADLSNAEMYYTNANQAMFLKTNLNELDAYQADFIGANFNEASMVGAVLCNCKASNCNFKRAIMLRTILINVPFDSKTESFLYVLKFTQKAIKTNHGEAHELLEKVVDEYIDKTGELKKIDDLEDEGQNFKACEFIETIANEIIVMNLNLMRSSFLCASVRSALFYNTLLRWCTLSQANFSNSIFIGVSFKQSNLKECIMTRARFFACDLSNANLSDANFISTKLEKVIFDESNLSKCNLASAHIHNCTFNKCNFEGVIFDSETEFFNCIFCGIDFSQTVGLSEVKIKNCIIQQDEHQIEDNGDICLTAKNAPHHIYAVCNATNMKEPRRYSTRNV